MMYILEIGIGIAIVSVVIFLILVNRSCSIEDKKREAYEKRLLEALPDSWANLYWSMRETVFRGGNSKPRFFREPTHETAVLQFERFCLKNSKEIPANSMVLFFDLFHYDHESVDRLKKASYHHLSSEYLDGVE